MEELDHKWTTTERVKLSRYEYQPEVLRENRLAFLSAVRVHTPDVFDSFCKELQPIYGRLVKPEPDQIFDKFFLEFHPWSLLSRLTETDSTLTELREAISSWAVRHRLDESRWCFEPTDFFYDVCLSTLSLRQEVVVRRGVKLCLDDWMDFWRIADTFRFSKLQPEEEVKRAQANLRRSYAEAIRSSPQSFAEIDEHFRAKGEYLGANVYIREALAEAGIDAKEPRDSITLEFSRWNPDAEGWAIFAKRMRNEFKSALATYQERREVELENKDITEATEKGSSHFQWLAIAYFGGKDNSPLTVEEVMQKVAGNVFREKDSSTIRRGIKGAAEVAGLINPVAKGA